MKPQRPENVADISTVYFIFFFPGEAIINDQTLSSDVCVAESAAEAEMIFNPFFWKVVVFLVGFSS